MADSPQLHYLNHVQNTSISRNCHKFATAPRFPEHNKIGTQFKYNIKLKSQRRYCNFGFGNRSTIQHDVDAPGPNHYNIIDEKSKYRPITMSQSRQKVKFGTIGVEITKKSHIPAPGAYKLPETLRNNKFTLKQKLPDEIEIRLKAKTPGPGYYDSENLNENGKYICSNNKNVRQIILDANKSQPFKKQLEVGPGSYDLFNKDSRFSKFKIEKMRRTSIKSFGTDERKGPEYKHKKYIPGPGIYQSFSTFGDNYQRRHVRSITEAE